MLDFLRTYWPWLLLAFIIIDVLLIFYILLRKRRRKLKKKDCVELLRLWQQVEGESNHRQAILDADKLLDSALSRLGYTGYLGEKLRALPHLFSDIRGVWQAHALRNRVAHEINMEVSYKERRQALNSFRKALKNLGLS